MGITHEERKAFLTGMVSEQTADIKEDVGEFFVKKVIKMHVNKKERDEFLVKWVGYALSEATWESFENLSGKEACECQVVLIHTITMLVYIIVLAILIYYEEDLAMKREENVAISSQVN